MFGFATVLLIAAEISIEIPTALPYRYFATYDAVTGEIAITCRGVVNAYVESRSGSLVPGLTDDAPKEILVSDNRQRVGVTGFGGIHVTRWTSYNRPGLPPGDLILVVGESLGRKPVVHLAGSARFTYGDRVAASGWQRPKARCRTKYGTIPPRSITVANLRRNPRQIDAP